LSQPRHRSPVFFQAAKALRIALKLGQDHTLAYQGLANCADAEDLPEIYEKLLQLTP
jgi:hypothetical protein